MKITRNLMMLAVCTLLVMGLSCSNNVSHISMPTATNESAPSISLSQSSFAFVATEGESNPPAQTLTIHNSGGGLLSYQIDGNADWLNTGLVKGNNINAGESYTSQIGVSIAGLKANTYTAIINVSSSRADNTPQIIPVTLIINPVSTTIHHTTWGGAWLTIYEGGWGSQVGDYVSFPATFDYDWGNGTVISGYSENIGLTASATIKMQRTNGGPVTFTVGSTDLINLYLDDNLTAIISLWPTDNKYSTKSIIVNLTPGFHGLQIHYRHEKGPAHISFSCDSDVLEWQSTSNVPWE